MKQGRPAVSRARYGVGRFTACRGQFGVECFLETEAKAGRVAAAQEVESLPLAYAPD